VPILVEDASEDYEEMLQYLHMLKLWGLEKEAFNKIRLVAKHIENPYALKQLSMEFKNDKDYDYVHFTSSSYRGSGLYLS